MELVSRLPSGFQNFEVAPFHIVLSSGYRTYDVGELYYYYYYYYYYY